MARMHLFAGQKGLNHSTCSGSGTQMLSLSIFADRAHVRAALRDDGEAAGFRVVEDAELAALGDGQERSLGEVVLLDCPEADGAILTVLTRLDIHAARVGAALVVSTSVDALEDVFGCLDRSSPQILVNPSRSERLIALGRELARSPSRGVRELSEGDRMVLLRLTEQVNQIAKQMQHFSALNQESPSRIGSGPSHGASSHAIDIDAAMPRAGSAFRFAPSLGLPQADVDDGGDRLVREARPSLPEPKLVRRIIRQRQLRSRFFGDDLFADPAWDMLLDLTAARAEHSRVSVTSLCIASGVPPTTALRWIGQMIEAGLLERNDDKTDRRRAFITLTQKASDAMARMFQHLGDIAANII